MATTKPKAKPVVKKKVVAKKAATSKKPAAVRPTKVIQVSNDTSLKLVSAWLALIAVFLIIIIVKLY